MKHTSNSIRTPFPSLNECLGGGLAAKHVAVIGGRMLSLSNLLALNLAHYVASEQATPTAWFSSSKELLAETRDNLSLLDADADESAHRRNTRIFFHEMPLKEAGFNSKIILDGMRTAVEGLRRQTPADRPVLLVVSNELTIPRDAHPFDARSVAAQLKPLMDEQNLVVLLVKGDRVTSIQCRDGSRLLNPGIDAEYVFNLGPLNSIGKFSDVSARWVQPLTVMQNRSGTRGQSFCLARDERTQTFFEVGSDQDSFTRGVLGSSLGRVAF